MFTNLLYNRRAQSWALQALLILVLIGTTSYLAHNVEQNLAKQNIASGFGFLKQQAGFDIGEAMISYGPEDNYGKALLTGALNTLKVAIIGNILAMGLGLFLGLSLISSNWALAKASRAWVNSIRNVPLLLQLFFWYSLFSGLLPSVRNAEGLLGSSIFFTNRGLFLPWFSHEHSFKWFLVLELSLVLLSVLGPYLMSKKSCGPRFSVVFVLFTAVAFFFLPGVFFSFESPELKGFNFQGGLQISPEFMALLLGLVLYTSVFIAEIVRSGILSVGKGQREAAKALGLSSAQIMSLVILPQALRVMIPPLTAQFLNLTKNSSLAVAIAYPDFVSVAITSMNQTGQAIEMVSLIMGMYLFYSLSTSAFMNWFNAKVQVKER